MSGPKTARYTVSAEQRRLLQIQRQTAEERALMEHWQQQLRSVLADADNAAEELRPFQAEGISPALAEFLTERKDAARLLAQSEKGDLPALRKRNQKLQAAVRQVQRRAEAVRLECQRAERAFRKENGQKMSEGVSFTAPSETGGSVTNSEMSVQWITAIQEATHGLLPTELRRRGEEIAEKVANISESAFLKNYISITVQPFLRECRAWQEAYARDGQEYEEKLARCQAEAAELGVPMEQIPFSKDAVTVLDRKLQEMERQLRKRDEQEYLRQCVDEAMEEMGYALIGSRELTRRNGKTYRNELYLFDEGTAVSVTRSEDGQIAMELGGLGTVDRLPTAQEAAALAVEMGEFCQEYAVLERRLREKGIDAQRLSVLPPDAQFAQIINMSDYSMKQEVPEFAVHRRSNRQSEIQSRRIGE